MLLGFFCWTWLPGGSGDLSEFCSSVTGGSGTLYVIASWEYLLWACTSGSRLRVSPSFGEPCGLQLGNETPTAEAKAVGNFW